MTEAARSAQQPRTHSVYVYLSEPQDGPGMTIPVEPGRVMFDRQGGELVGIEVLDAIRVTIDGAEAESQQRGGLDVALTAAALARWISLHGEIDGDTLILTFDGPASVTGTIDSILDALAPQPSARLTPQRKPPADPPDILLMAGVLDQHFGPNPPSWQVQGSREQQMAYWHAHAEAIVAALRTATPPAEHPPAESEPDGSLEAGKSDGE